MKLTPDWITGFVDGEGCFCISLQNMPKMTYQKQIRLVFKVSQHRRNVQVLYALKTFFGVGHVKSQRKTSTPQTLVSTHTSIDPSVETGAHEKESDVWEYTCSKFDHIVGIIIPFFEKNQLHTSKYFDFRRFRRTSILMQRKHHLTLDGLAEIERIRSRMVSSGEVHPLSDEEILD